MPDPEDPGSTSSGSSSGKSGTMPDPEDPGSTSSGSMSRKSGTMPDPEDPGSRQAVTSLEDLNLHQHRWQ